MSKKYGFEAFEVSTEERANEFDVVLHCDTSFLAELRDVIENYLFVFEKKTPAPEIERLKDLVLFSNDADQMTSMTAEALNVPDDIEAEVKIVVTHRK